MGKAIILMVMLALLLCSCASQWYTQYGIADKETLNNQTAAPNLIQALSDPSANVRKTAMRYIALHESSIREAEPKLKEIARDDEHPNVRLEAERLLTILNEKKTAEVDLYDCDCSGFSATIGNEQIYFATRFISKYYPEDFRPLNGDNVKINYYRYNNKNIILSVEALDLVKERFLTEKPIIGTIGTVSKGIAWKWEKQYPLIVDNNRQIIINLGMDTSKVLPPPRYKGGTVSLAEGDKVRVFTKDPTVGKGSCYVYSVEKIEFADR